MKCIDASADQQPSHPSSLHKVLSDTVIRSGAEWAGVKCLSCIFFRPWAHGTGVPLVSVSNHNSMAFPLPPQLSRGWFPR
jgi:hypothetical protein